MANLKDTDELMKMPQSELIKYLDGINKELFDSDIMPNPKVRYFLAKFGGLIAKLIQGTHLFFPAIVAQSITESGYGRSVPEDSNNYAGIKYAPNLAGVIGFVLADTSEVVNGRKIKVKAKFSKFIDPTAGFKAHIQVLLGDRYKNARLNATSPEEQLRMIAAAGYSTTPANRYASDMRGNIKRARDLSGLSIIN
jgi:flagellum-specific peptidoglycan hydrolase FlgJ